MNGYFRLENSETGTGITLFPATDGGEELKVNEVVDYLAFKGVEYDITRFYACVKKMGSEPVTIPLNEKQGVAEQEMLIVQIASNDMSASARFYAPSNDGSKMDKREIMNDLRHRGVTFGVLEEAVDHFLSSREYCMDFTIARGKESNPGQDAHIDYFFNTESKVRPTLQEDGSVDFFHLNTVNHCKKGQVLARLVPEVPSEPGINVRGGIIPAREVKRCKLQCGRNMELSEDGKEVLASVNGHVSFIDGRIFVSDLLELGSVDNSTGNIEYEGSVQINGNVCENFTVKVNGNVQIKGVVEGAVVEAAGDVVIERGMNGMGKGIIKAGGNVIAKFLENAEVEAGGYVQSDSILHSKVLSRDEINVGGKRGFITGGSVCALNGVKVKTLGSAMGADTIVEVGADPTVKVQIADLQQKIVEGGKVLKSTQPILANMAQKISQGVKLAPSQLDYVKKLNALYKMKQEEIEAAENELDELQKMLEGNKNVAVIVTDIVYAGTRIGIGDVSMVLKSNMQYCRFVKERGDVKSKPI